MGYNKLLGFEYDNKTIFCSAYDTSNNIMDLTNYTGTLYVKSMVPDSSICIENVGTKDSSSLSLTFNITLPIKGDYVYQIDISSNTKKYTIVSDKLSVSDSIKF